MPAPTRFLPTSPAQGRSSRGLVELGGGLELDVFGEPSAALRAAVAAFQPRIYSYSQGK